MNEQYLYPAIFTKDEASDSILIVFPDFVNSCASAEGMLQAMTMAKDLLAMTLCELEERGMEIPPMTELPQVTKTLDGTSFASYVDCDTGYYRRKHRNTSVKKTLSIPSWLNVIAEDNHVNFSALLQKALKEELGVND